MKVTNQPMSQICEKAIELTDEIAEKSKRLLNLNLDITAIREEMDEIELDLRGIIASQTDQNGKAVYSNDEKRKAALYSELPKNQRYRELKQRLSSLTMTRDLLEIEYTSVRDLHNTLCAFMSAK